VLRGRRQVTGVRSVSRLDGTKKQERVCVIWSKGWGRGKKVLPNRISKALYTLSCGETKGWAEKAGEGGVFALRHRKLGQKTPRSPNKAITGNKESPKREEAQFRVGGDLYRNNPDRTGGVTVVKPGPSATSASK